jgi:glycosyltransferase involved in cell wall biosynthesis
MKKPLVSVIIPCYNYAEFIEKCIKSVVSQTYDNIEVIVINDGSTDDTDAIVTKLRQEFKIRYIKRENKGIIATRNEGVRLSKGDFLIQLDADDWLDNSFIEKTLTRAVKTGSDISYTQVHIFGRADFVTKYPDFKLEYLKHANYIHASALVRRSVFRHREYDSYLNDKGYEDWDLFLDACMDGAKAVLVDEPLLHYQKHSMPRSRSDKFENTRKESLATHHILSKQNAKHPGEMWYLSGYIALLKKQVDIDLYIAETESRLQKAQEEAEAYGARLRAIRSTAVYKAYLKLRHITKMISR